MNLASRVLPTIVKYVKKYGNSFTLIGESSGGEYVNGDYVPSAPTETPFKGAEEFVSLKDVQGQIQQGDLQIICVFDDVVPESNNKIVYRDVEYSIVEIQPLYFQDVLMAYNIIARK